MLSIRGLSVKYLNLLLGSMPPNVLFLVRQTNLAHDYKRDRNPDFPVSPCGYSEGFVQWPCDLPCSWQEATF